MNKQNNIPDSNKKAEKCFKNIKLTLKGLNDILKISFTDENNLYLKLAQDNIIVLYHNILDLLLNEKGLKDLQKKLQDSDLKVDIPLNSFLKSED